MGSQNEQLARIPKGFENYGRYTIEMTNIQQISNSCKCEVMVRQCSRAPCNFSHLFYVSGQKERHLAHYCWV